MLGAAAQIKKESSLFPDSCREILKEQNEQQPTAALRAVKDDGVKRFLVVTANVIGDNHHTGVGWALREIQTRWDLCPWRFSRLGQAGLWLKIALL